MRLLIIGPPGAGKGTQAKHVAARYDIPAISTGDIFRDNVNRGTRLGLEARRHMDAGQYVPDEVTNLMVRARLGDEDACRGFILDGYPRTLPQVDELDQILAEAGGPSLQAVLHLLVPLEEVVARLLQRSKVEGRADDTGDVIRRRQEIYRGQTEPVVEAYRRRGLLHDIDGTGAVEDVVRRILDSLDERRAPCPGATAGS